MSTQALPTKRLRRPLGVAAVAAVAAVAIGLHCGATGVGLGDGVRAAARIVRSLGLVDGLEAVFGDTVPGSTVPASAVSTSVVPASAVPGGVVPTPADPLDHAGSKRGVVPRPRATMRQRITARVVFRIRLPRVLLGFLVGSALAVAGVGFQSLLRNPLADPFILGVSGGAAVGAASVLLFAGGAAFGVMVPLALTVPAAAFAGALGAAGLVYGIARRRSDGVTGEGLLLTGVVVNAFLSSLILFLTQLAPPGKRLLVISWMTGNLGACAIGRAELVVLTGATCAGLWLFFRASTDLDLFTLGDETAESLGVSVRTLRSTLFVAGSLVTGAAVAFAGLIGFVGLIVPHAVRMVLGPGHRRLIPVSFVAGGAFLVVADALARIAMRPEELPVGVLTALSGGPFFLWLLTRKSGAAGRIA